jgi:integrase
MASRFLMTTKALHALIDPSKEQRVAEHYDTQQPGLLLRCGHGGARSWYLAARIMRRGKRRPVRTRLGHFPAMSLKEARHAARSTLLQIRDGKDPALVRREAERQMLDASARVFEVVMAEYLARKERQWSKRHYTDTARILRGDDLKGLLAVPVTQITPDDVEAIVDRIIDRGKVPMAGHTRTALVTFFDWCLEPRRKYVTENPAKATDKPKGTPTTKRALTDNEIREFWRRLRTAPISESVRRVLRLLLITGQRTSDVLHMQRSELDLGARLWTIPAARFKTRIAHEVPLSDMALKQLQDLPEQGFVFRSKSTGGPFSDKVLAKAVARWHDKVGTPRADRWAPHHLRHTVRSGMSRIHVDSEICERVVGHIVGSAIARVYNHWEYREEKAEALNAWSQALWALVVDEVELELEGLI